jgi:putative ABC transport system permease protein
VVMIPLTPNVGKNYTPFKKDLQALPSIQEVSVALHPLYKGFDMMGVKPKNTEEMILMPTLMVDQHFISLLKLKWKEQPADTLFHSNRKNVAILNETAVERLNLGHQATNEKVDNQFQVAGVLKDFNYTSLQNKIEPLCVFVVPDTDTSALWSHQGGCVYAKITGGTNIASLIDQLKIMYERYEQEKPFEISFMDEASEAQYKAEDRLSNILNMFTAFAILIASLGLFGLATFMAVQRTKEIGVRKVLGATVQNIVVLLSKDFLKLVVVAILIASPVAWWAMNGWLQNFAYRIHIEWWMFVAGSLFLVTIALLTVSYHAISAAIAKPTKSLKTE